MESYTIGRECFGMEKEFIIEVVQNCPNPACRYYKNQLELSQKSLHLSAPTYISESGGQDKFTLHLTTKIFFFSSPLGCGPVCYKVQWILPYFMKSSKIFCPTRRGGVSGTWPWPAATLTLTLWRTECVCLLHKLSFHIYVRENIPVFQSLQKLVLMLVHGSLFIIFRPSHLIWWALPTATWTFSFLNVTGHCRAKLSRIQIYKYTLAVFELCLKDADMVLNATCQVKYG